MNPFNDLFLDDNYIPISEIKLSNESYEIEYIKKINGSSSSSSSSSSVNKKFYIATNMNPLENPEVYNDQFYSMVMAEQENAEVFLTPQLNNITFKMPKKPLLLMQDKLELEVKN